MSNTGNRRMFDPYDPTDEFTSDGGDDRITEVTVDVDGVVVANMDEFKMSTEPDSDVDYEDPHSYTHLGTRRKIKLGRGDREDLSRIIDDFPTDEPLVVQSALWMHAIAGVHFFPDANHRTAMKTLRAMMDDNGTEPFKPFGDFERRTYTALDASKKVRRNLNIDMGNYYEKDDLYEVWRRYFDDVLYPSGR
ncbi:hypothetical protein ACEU6E_06490 [Halorutilales archaeon Cl-col2-1]